MSVPQPGPKWRENTGKAATRSKRVRVFLASGHEPVYDDNWNPMAPPGWATDTTRWTLTGSPFDVAWYLPL